ncbi:MAG: sigma-70 family RNA polymerase sigma factor [Oligoflexia bacterium]|nr:sigma-70 family RNA polymerase sigma factor [Oligoflexia bacterium]
MSSPHAVTEQRISAHLAAGETQAGVALAIDSYGPSLFGYLASRLSREVAEDAFQDLCEQILLAAPRFEGRCSFRVWAFHLARGVRCKVARDPYRRRGSRLSDSQLQGLVERSARTVTAEWRRTDRQVALLQACQALAEEDQAVLLLRIDQQMSWLDVARVIFGQSQSQPELRRQAACLRKRFERTKDKLRTQLARPGGQP